MKVLMLNYRDNLWGGFIAAKRLLDAMVKNGVNVSMGVVEKTVADEHVFIFPKNENFSKQTKRRSRKNRLQTTNTSYHIVNKYSRLSIDAINNSDFDVVHLHCLNDSLLSIEDVGKIKKPIVWTLHDFWAFSGAEQYPNVLENDKRFVEGYTKQNMPDSSFGVDICRLTWERKKTSWKSRRFTFIAPSHFIAESCRQSALFKEIIPAVIPNIVPNIVFRQLDKTTLRKFYNIPLNKKIIGFGASIISDDKKHVKGGYFLIEALKKIKQKENYFAVVFGSANNSFLESLSVRAFEAGQIQNPYILATIYNLLDVFVCPSVIDNLPNTCVESLFCGVPVAAFNYGGIPDIVEHKVTGYLAKPYNTNDLLKGIEYCVENAKELSKNSIAKAKHVFNEKEIIKKHLEVYKKIMET